MVHGDGVGVVYLPGHRERDIFTFLLFSVSISLSFTFYFASITHFTYFTFNGPLSLLFSYSQGCIFHHILFSFFSSSRCPLLLSSFLIYLLISCFLLPCVSFTSLSFACHFPLRRFSFVSLFRSLSLSRYLISS